MDEFASQLTGLVKHIVVLKGGMGAKQRRAPRHAFPCHEHGHAVQVAVFAGEDCGTARRADRIDGIAAVKPHPLIREPVQLRRLVHSAAVGADGVRRVVVRHDEQDVRAIGGTRAIACRVDEEQKQE